MGDMPHIEAAVALAAAFIRDTWQQVVVGTLQVPGAKSPKVNVGLREIYANSIATGNVIVRGGSVTQRILAATQIASDLEDGKGPWDMKPMLLNGPKARLSKKGIVFNIIPFRQGAPGGSGENAHFKNMPQNVYEAAKALKPTLATSRGPAGRETILNYGQSLNKKDHGSILGPPQIKLVYRNPGDRLPMGGYTHKNDIHEGMLKIQASYGKAVQSKYLTFRVVSENSAHFSWWHPGRPPQHHLQFISDFCLPKIEKNLSAAAERDFLGLNSVGMDITVE